MAADIMVVPKEDWEVLSRYLVQEHMSGIVLIPQDVYDKLPEKAKKFVDDPDAGSDYGFGGESDLMVDVVLNKQHYIFSHLNADTVDTDEKKWD